MICRPSTTVAFGESPKYPPNNSMNPTCSSLYLSQAGYAGRWAANNGESDFKGVRTSDARLSVSKRCT